MQRWNNCLYTGSSISRANLVKSSLYSNYLSIQFILQYLIGSIYLTLHCPSHFIGFLSCSPFI